MHNLSIFDLPTWTLINKLRENRLSVTQSLQFLTSLGMSQSTARKCLTTVLDKGIIRIEVSDKDKRAKVVRLSKKYAEIASQLLDETFSGYLDKFANYRRNRFRAYLNN
jgi:DNA-binding MarR family transcriptional regulator